jgi:hypothetical protein
VTGVTVLGVGGHLVTVEAFAECRLTIELERLVPMPP